MDSPEHSQVSQDTASTDSTPKEQPSHESQQQYITLYETGAHPCSYLSGQQAATQFLDPKLPVDAGLAEQLSELGFRRSGRHNYRPHCPNCNACIPLRINTNDFYPNRTQRKIINRNQDLDLIMSTPGLTLENYRLYRRYIQMRHHDGDMFPPNAQQFMDFLGVNTGFTRFWEFRKNGSLAGVAVTDHFPGSLSSVYSFFDQGFEGGAGRRSLGIYFILKQITIAKAAGLPWLYLGYWIEECKKMRYKTAFPPQQQFVQGKWSDIPSS